MKKILYTFLLSSCFLMANAQLNHITINNEDLNCGIEQPNNLILNKQENKSELLLSVTHENKVAESSVTGKNKKHFIKKVLSNFEGADIKDAWSLLSYN